jgi:hypothetical protein
MQFVTHNSHRIDPTGTSLQGRVNATFVELLTLFGEPHDGDRYKTDAEWTIRFEDGVIATVYNWKNGHNYCGTDGLPVEAITEWNVGGQTKQAADRISIALDLHREGRTETDDIAEVIAVSEDMLRSIEQMHGQAFSQAVNVCRLAIKANELLRMARTYRDKDVVDIEVADGMSNAMSCLTAQMLGIVVRQLGFGDLDSGKPQQILEWAARISNAETKAAEAVFDRDGGSI